MISGISAATNGIYSALTRFERAAGVVANGFGETIDPAEPAAEPNATDMVSAEIDIMNARFAFSASLVALRASTEMLAGVIELGGYGLSEADR